MMRYLQLLLFTALLLAGCRSSTPERATDPDTYYTCLDGPPGYRTSAGLVPYLPWS
ncbi:MAG: hypothetical protein IPI05_05270 [Flavobacteriales bacterium]|nr:hypothetical protein [Flavobacteriales bacterium]